MSQAVITVTGKLSKDAESRFTAEGKAMLTLSIPVQRGKDKPTVWYNAVLMGKKVENEAFVALLKKGTIVSVTGDHTFSEYEKSDGAKGYSNGVFVSMIDVEFGDKKAQATEEEAPAEIPF
jgi:single-stranded DNA-binding protein